MAILTKERLTNITINSLDNRIFSQILFEAKQERKLNGNISNSQQSKRKTLHRADN